MAFKLVIFLCFWAEVASAVFDDLKLEADKPLVRVALSHEATIRCCYRWNESPEVKWIHTANYTIKPSAVNMSNNLIIRQEEEKDGVKCNLLLFKKVHLSDTALYQCKLKHKSHQVFTHGTFLQVYKPLQKTLNLSESAKNSILTAEGVLLLMCVLIPGTMLICKSKRLNQLERKKDREEENIYEGLNLDDCNSAYHQIQRTSQQGPYQDVASCGEDIQLEKP